MHLSVQYMCIGEYQKLKTMFILIFILAFRFLVSYALKNAVSSYIHNSKIFALLISFSFF